jgi:hypothetical protein
VSTCWDRKKKTGVKGVKGKDKESKSGRQKEKEGEEKEKNSVGIRLINLLASLTDLHFSESLLKALRVIVKKIHVPVLRRKINAYLLRTSRQILVGGPLDAIKKARRFFVWKFMNILIYLFLLLRKLFLFLD